MKREIIKKLMAALKETIRLMGEVDRVIDVHGGGRLFRKRSI